IQLPPGEYAVRAEMMGYRSVTFEEVRIKLDRTTIVNFELKPTMIEVPGITVIAERALIEHDVTASVRYASRDEIERTPNIEKSTELVRLQPGVTGSHIRSGRTSETVYYIDGIAVRHPIYGSTAALDLDVMAIKEMEMLTGGFNAEYGQAQSGVVNIITREGGKKLSGELLYKTDNLSPKDCSFNTDYAAFAFGGTLPFLPFDVRFFFSGSGSFTDGYLDNHRTREEREFMGIKYHDRQSNSTNFNLKLTYNISPNYKLNLGYRRGYHWYSGDEWGGYNWGWKNLPDSTNNTYKMTSQGVLSFTHSLSENTFYSIHLGHLFTHSHDDLWGRTPPEFWHWEYYWQDTLWEYEWGNVWLFPDSTVIDSFVIDSIAIDSVIADSEYVSNTGWGNDINGDGFIDEGVYQYWSDDSSWVWTAKFDFTSQIHPRHLIKFGFNIDYEDILYTNIQYYGSFRSPGSERP
ncbi:TonB-dependent receptor, partial [candidate division WOR-3 bacterium]|nr:TonB-dependent receptor [candidate division WOR-3 bacterium]